MSPRPYLLCVGPLRRWTRERWDDDDACRTLSRVWALVAYARRIGWPIGHVLPPAASHANDDDDPTFPSLHDDSRFVRSGASAITSPAFATLLTGGELTACYLVGAVLTRAGLATLLSLSEFSVPAFVVDGAFFRPSAQSEQHDLTGPCDVSDIELLASFVSLDVSAEIHSANLVDLGRRRWERFVSGA